MGRSMGVACAGVCTVDYVCDGGMAARWVCMYTCVVGRAPR